MDDSDQPREPLTISTSLDSEPAPGTNWRECPNCYEIYDYSQSGDRNLLPRLLNCRHLVCSKCASELWIDAGICCPTCMEMSDCNTMEELPIPAGSPLCSPSSKKNSFSNESMRATDCESDGSVSSTSSRKSNKLKDFMISSPIINQPLTESELKQHLKKTICVMENCTRKRGAGRYFCEMHQDKARRVTWRSAERLLQRYETVSHYRHSTGTVDKNGKLMQQLGPEPNLERLSPKHLMKIFTAQDSLAMGEALWLIDESIRVFSDEPNVLRLEAPMRIVGDLHGQFFDLLSMLKMCGIPGEAKGPSNKGYLFLGDYVDRGAFSCEVMLYLLSLKLTNPGKVHMLRGNHECRSLTGHFGFKAECKAKYGLPVYYRFLKLFESLPLCALVTGEKGRYFCAHGGISPDLRSIDDIDELERRAEPPMSGMLCDILWSDPADDPGFCPLPERMNSSELETLLGESYVPNRLRGCSVSFGYSAAVRFLEENNLLCLIRAHAVQEGGYYRHFEDALKWCRNDSIEVQSNLATFRNEDNPIWNVVAHARPLPAVITVFSAPNYCGRYGNKGAILTLEHHSVEPVVIQYECVPSPAPKAGAESRADMHLTALIEACPYMPSTFRDFVIVAGRMGPAQPLQGAKSNGAATAAAMVCGPSVAETAAVFEARSRIGSGHRAGSFAAVVGATGEEGGPMTTHVMYRAMAANDRINERHPEALFEIQDDRQLSKNGSLNELVRRFSVQALLKRFEPKQSIVRERNLTLSPRRSPMRHPIRPEVTASSVGSPRRSPLRNSIFPEDMEISENSRLHHSLSPMRSEINMSSAVESPLSPSSRQRLRWNVDDQREKLDHELSLTPPMSPSPLLPEPNTPVHLFSPDRGRPTSRPYSPHDTYMHNQSHMDSSGKLSAPSQAARFAFAGRGGGPNSPRYSKPMKQSWKPRHVRPTHPIGPDDEADYFVDKMAENGHSDVPRKNLEGSGSPAKRAPKGSPMPRASPAKRGGKTPDPLWQVNSEADEYTFSEEELLGLRLLFALMDYNDTKFIDANALQMYAGEHDDYAQAAEVQACIDAVDVDGDGKIGLMDFLSSAARLKNVYEMSLAQDKEKKESAKHILDGDEDGNTNNME